jgi:hypothetical protein
MRPTRRERLHMKACLTFALAVEDECVERLSTKPAVVRQRAAELDRLGFLRPPLAATARVRDFASDAHGHAGAFERLEPVGVEQLVASGRARLPDAARAADAVLLAYEAGGGGPLVFSIVEVGGGGDADGWRKTISLSKLPPGKISLSAWAFDSLEGKAFKLDGTHDAR